MDHKNWFQYWVMVIKHSAIKAWEKFGAIGTFIGIVVPVIAVYITRRPSSWVDFWKSDAVITVVIIAGLFSFVLLVYITQEPLFIYNSQQKVIGEFADDDNLIKVNLGVEKYFHPYRSASKENVTLG